MRIFNLLKKKERTKKGETSLPKEERKEEEDKTETEEQPKPKKSNKRKTLGNGFQKLVDSKNDDEIIKFLKRCEINACGGAPVRSALGFDVSETVMDWLVEQGADVNFRNSYGATPLHHHAGMRAGNVKYLIKLGADVNAKDKMGETPLINAVSNFRLENIKILVDAGADINVTYQNLSLVDLALRSTYNSSIPDCVKVVEYLLDKGVKLTGEEAKEVTRIGEQFEFSYNSMDPACIDEP
jgi:ankyrin repeat protein